MQIHFQGLPQGQALRFHSGKPAFNMKEWGGDQLKDDRRWKYGVPPEGNANFAWLQHMIYHLYEDHAD